MIITKTARLNYWNKTRTNNTLKTTVTIKNNLMITWMFHQWANRDQKVTIIEISSKISILHKNSNRMAQQLKILDHRKVREKWGLPVNWLSIKKINKKISDENKLKLKVEFNPINKHKPKIRKSAVFSLNTIWLLAHHLTDRILIKKLLNMLKTIWKNYNKNGNINWKNRSIPQA